jgi:RNA polymerase sigma-70 factor, ECF subfamily
MKVFSCRRDLFSPEGFAPVASAAGIMDSDGLFALLPPREGPVMPVRSTPDRTPLLELELLMSGYQQADEEAVRTLIEKVSPLLLRYFWVQAANRRFAEDLMQETWMRIHRARHTYRRGEPVLPWILAIARHTGVDNYRKVRRVEVRETQVDILPETAAAAQHFTRDAPDLDMLLAELPPSQREVIVMLKVSGMSIDEVARATSSSAGSVKQKAHRAYTKLREVLSGRGGAHEA